MEALLDAAEELLAEQGYEAASLKAIGQRAGIPVASVYHYFADRSQVEAELVQRHIAVVGERLAPALGGPAQDHPGPTTIRAALDAVIDPILAYFRESPSFIELWLVGRSATLSDLARAFDVSEAERLGRFLRERGLIAEDTPPLALELCFEVGDRLFDVAFRQGRAGDDAVIGEMRRLLTAYLESYAPTG
jgi:AcrR family transcriptional regulator